MLLLLVVPVPVPPVLCRYDHIVPFYGVCSASTVRGAALLQSDAVTMSSDYTVRGARLHGV